MEWYHKNNHWIDSFKRTRILSTRSQKCHVTNTYYPHLGDSGLPVSSPTLERVRLLPREQPAKSDHSSMVGSHSVPQNQPYFVCKGAPNLLTLTFPVVKVRNFKKYSPDAQDWIAHFAQSFMGSLLPPPSCWVIAICWVHFLVKFLVFLDNQGLWSSGDVLLLKLRKVVLPWHLRSALLQRWV